MGCLTREILAGFASVFLRETIGFQGEGGAQPGKRSAPLRGECLNADWLETCPRPGREARSSASFQPLNARTFIKQPIL
jgi:hypothetical protein